jgi:hypothetical protein
MKIEQIKQIYDYTKYHIGFYSTLISVLTALITFSYGNNVVGENNAGERYRPLIFVIITVLLIAGVAGALVASRIVYGPWGTKYFLIDHSWFWKKRWHWPKRWNWWWSWADLCLIIEHYGFWLALLIAIVGVLYVNRRI